MVDAVPYVPSEAQVENFRSEVREASASAGLRRLQRARRPDDVGASVAAASAALIVRSSRILFILYSLNFQPFITLATSDGQSAA